MQRHRRYPCWGVVVLECWLRRTRVRLPLPLGALAIAAYPVASVLVVLEEGLMR